MGVSELSNHDMVSEAVKASPPITVVGLTLGGVTLQDWVYILTIFHLMLLIGWFIYSKILRKAPPSED